MAPKHHCPICNHGLGDLNALYQHVKAKHGKKAARAHRPPVEREPSMGDLVAEAQINRALGLPVEPWIAEMFDV
ncbi:hypothetical protein [Methylobacterium komagatae]